MFPLSKCTEPILFFCLSINLTDEFKPASIDKSQPGSLHKNKENRVTVEFHNNQPGKPKVSFEGSSEDYKDNDAVLFFDGETFRLERLHRAVKRLRHVRLPGESAASAANMASAASAAATNIASAASASTNMESHSPQLGKISKTQPLNKPIVPSIHVSYIRMRTSKLEFLLHFIISTARCGHRI